MNSNHCPIPMHPSPVAARALLCLLAGMALSLDASDGGRGDRAVNILSRIQLKNTLNLQSQLAHGLVSVVEDKMGRLYFVFGGSAGALLAWRGEDLCALAQGDLGGAAVASEGSIWYTLGCQVKMIPPSPPGIVSDQTEAFGGPPRGGRRVFCGRRGELWVEGCPKFRTREGQFRSVPVCASGAMPAPIAEDPFGNAWGLAPDPGNPEVRHVVGLLGPQAKEWKRLAPEIGPGRWDTLVIDEFGFIWVAGAPGLARFDPRTPGAGWVAFPKDRLTSVPVTGLGLLPNVPAGMPALPMGPTVTAMGLAPEGVVLAGFADGTVCALDIQHDGSKILDQWKIPVTPGPAVEAIHCDRAGTLWVVADGDIYQAKPPPEAWPRRWKALARLPMGNHDFYGALLGGKLYAAGGFTDGGFPAVRTSINALWAYDVNLDQWSTLPVLPTQRGFCGIAALEGEIWVLGGFVDQGGKMSATDVTEVYNPATGQWRRGPALDTPRAELVALPVGDRLYVIGGASTTNEFKTVISIGPGEANWRAEPDAPGRIRQASGAVLDGRIYIGAGWSIECPGLYVFDALRRRWEESIPAPAEKPANAPLTVAYRNEIWVMGGWGTANRRAVYRYSPLRKAWAAGPELPIPLAWGAAAEMGGNLIIAGGAYHSPEHGHFIFSDRTFMLREN